jgi:8-hydroxy-5-deazaflavin:NADPH oxidoreductase
MWRSSASGEPGLPSKLRRVDVSVIGGTGAEGFGLAVRLASAGHRVVIGSRSEERGAEAAARARELLATDPARVEGTSNDGAAEAADALIVTVPFAGQAQIYRALKPHVRRDAVVVDATSPLATAVGGRPWQVLRPWQGSAAEQAESLLGGSGRIVAAFHTISAEALSDLGRPVDSDVLVCGSDADSKAVVGALVDDIPNLRWVDAGPLSMARIAETMTALLVSVNRRYGIRDAGFRVTGRGAWGGAAT